MVRDGADRLRLAIVGAEAARLDAMISTDLAVLDGLLDESLSYVHSTGRRDGKESLLGFISSGTVRFLEIGHELDEVRQVAAGVAVATGAMRMRLVSGGVEKSISTRTSSVWVSRGSAWNLVVFHGTTLPAS